jgi:hypothetical protein
VRDSQGGELALSYEWQRRLERWKSTMRGLFGGGGGSEQGPRPQLCPACGSLVGISATKCHVCGTSLRFSLAAFSKKFSGVFGEHEAPVTTALLIANILMLGISYNSGRRSKNCTGLRDICLSMSLRERSAFW